MSLRPICATHARAHTRDQQPGAGKRVKQVDLDRVLAPNLRRAAAKEVDRLHVRNFVAINLTPVKGSKEPIFLTISFDLCQKGQITWTLVERSRVTHFFDRFPERRRKIAR